MNAGLVGAEVGWQSMDPAQWLLLMLLGAVLKPC